MPAIKNKKPFYPQGDSALTDSEAARQSNRLIYDQTGHQRMLHLRKQLLKTEHQAGWAGSIANHLAVVFHIGLIRPGAAV